MNIAITKVVLSKNPVSVNEKFLISVKIVNITAEPIIYRLPHRLGNKKGGIK